MKSLTRIVSIALLCLALPGQGELAAQAAPDPNEPRPDRFLSNTRQLTFEGLRAGEGYFSADGSRLVFQSERAPGNPFYQIYELSFETGDTRRISPGYGKTTCAFVRPGTGEVLFGSTHHDPKSVEYQRAELELRASGRERRYAWDFDPEMEIYVAAAAGGDLRRLTTVRGYDAEASYSPDGDWIVFSSTRQAYERELTADEARKLETDASFFAELWLMRADGSDQRGLTAAAGYDGGPFFTTDGKNIVWRRFDEDGLIADIWIMDADGSRQRPVTEFASMSWAPYPHPSGEYLFFTSNKHGFENFELFIVDLNGTKQPVRVTFTPGFDGLPVPSPDGERLAWTSTRRTKGGQIFMATWDHEQAVEALRQAPERSRDRASDDVGGPKGGKQ